ncbi:MAG: hypothetical protein QOG53_1848 [Frankiales bacterium]|jgi:hypothetical protein|nr:hypothetical protein [Frankiales bacterium]
MLLAHGVGTRADLPIPTSYAAIAAAAVLVVSFLGLLALWREPRLDPNAGRPLPNVLQAAADSRALRLTLQSLTLVLAALVYYIGVTGPNDVTRNLTPWAFFVTFWVGLVPVSLLLGPVWRVINPLRALHAGLCAFLRLDADGYRPYPPAFSYRPAAVSIAAFAWYELCYPNRAKPAYVALFMLMYAVLHVCAALWYGRRWFERGDGFEVYSSLLGALAPIGRRADRRLVVRNPLNGLDAIKEAPGLVAVVIILVGSTAYDGFSRTSWYVENISPGTVNSTAMLAVCVLAIALLYLGGTYLATTLGAADNSNVRPETFAHTIVPIAAAYVVAHYFSLFVFDGQNTAILASDPFNKGWDIFGLNGHRIDYTAVSTRVISLVQIIAIVVGHVLAVIAAHDRAIRVFPYRTAVRTQIPLLVSMVVLTLIAVKLVLSG